MQPYETRGGLPSAPETYAKLMEHLRGAQECSAMLAHLANAAPSGDDGFIAKGWLTISDIFKLLQIRVTALAQGKLQ